MGHSPTEGFEELSYVKRPPAPDYLSVLMVMPLLVIFRFGDEVQAADAALRAAVIFENEDITHNVFWLLQLLSPAHIGNLAAQLTFIRAVPDHRCLAPASVFATQLAVQKAV